ncbi:putative protein isoform X1 [Capsicum galapagoense]
MALVISTLNGASRANRVHDFQLQVKWRHHGAWRPLCVQFLSGVQQLAPWLVLDNATFHPKVSHLQDQRWSHEESLKFWILHPKLSDGQSAQKGIMDF